MRIENWSIQFWLPQHCLNKHTIAVCFLKLSYYGYQNMANLWSQKWSNFRDQISQLKALQLNFFFFFFSSIWSSQCFGYPKRYIVCVPYSPCDHLECFHTCSLLLESIQLTITDISSQTVSSFQQCSCFERLVCQQNQASKCESLSDLLDL